MTKISNRVEKTIYVSPIIVQVLLDNEISLALESNPADGPNEGLQGSLAPQYFTNDPFKNRMV